MGVAGGEQAAREAELGEILRDEPRRKSAQARNSTSRARPRAASGGFFRNYL